jgi:cyclophilin family peptidyl-prolyl cis-trans isomerase
MRRRALLASAPLAAALLAGLGLAACGSKKSSATTETTAAGAAAAASSGAHGCTNVTAPSPIAAKKQTRPTGTLPANKTYDVTMVTNCGTFTFRIDQAQSPHAAASVVALVQNGFYNDTIFHRIVPGFVIQGGDPTQTGGGGPGYTTVDRPPASAQYTHGVVAMAKTQTQPPGAAGSQFFIVTERNAGLPPEYAIVGKVTKGLAVVDRIGRLGNRLQQPTRPVVIRKATVQTS